MTPCPSCGHANPEGARFCPECGTALAPTAPATAAAPAPREVRKTVTVLFADVAGSTTLGEELDPETLRALLGRYFAVMQRIIELHGGTVEKFIGDAVMAVFGIPVVHEDDALRAVRAAADIRTELAALDTELALGRGIAIRFRTGITTGEVVAGDPTGGQGFVTGDAVNTAARLEQAAAPGEILLGELTRQLVRDAVTVEPVEPIEARGKREPVAAYRLVAVDPALAGHARRLDTPLVGRERELAALHNAFERVASERSCQLFTLLGAAGVGKSRLVAEFTASVADEATILRGRCLSYGEGISFWPLREIIRTAARIAETDPPDEARAKLRALYEGERDADLLAERVAGAIGLSDRASPQEETFWAIRRLVDHVARERPLVVVIEDVHWATPTGLDLIEHVADLSRDAPLLLLCPARPELLDVRPSWGGGKFNATTVLLEPLGTDATDRLIAALPGGAALPPAIAARVATAAEGNPLYVEELLGILVDDGFLRETADGSWQAADELAGVRIPPSIGALLAARLDSLGADERSVAERASVVGRVFEAAAVTELATEALRREVGRSLLGLVRKELIRPERGEPTAGEAYKFRHILIRDAAYEAIPKAERARLHERFADWLERRSADDPGGDDLIVAYHLEQAYRYRLELGDDGTYTRSLADRAVGILAPAGRAARDRGDVQAAVSLLRRAADLSPEGRQRTELLIDLRSALWTAGDREASAAVDAEVVAFLAEHPDEGLEHHRWQAEAFFTLEVMVPEAQAAYDYYERMGDAMGMIRALEIAATASAGQGDFSGVLEIIDKAATLALEIGRPDRAAGLLAYSTPSFLDSTMPIPEALDRCERYLDLAGDDQAARVMILLALGCVEASSGVVDRWRRHFDTAKAIIDDLGLVFPLGVARYPTDLGDTELAAGDPARTVELLRSSCSTLDGLGERNRLASLAPLTAQTLVAVGRLDEVEHYAFWGRDIAHPDDVDAQFRWRVAVSGLRLEQARHDEAIGLARESVELLAGSGRARSLGIAHMALAMALRAAGDEVGAVASAHAAERLAAPRGDVATLRTITAFLRG